MRCTNRITAFLMIIGLLILCGCESQNVPIPYDPDTAVGAYTFDSVKQEVRAESFASCLCVSENDVSNPSLFFSPEVSGGLFAVDRVDTIFAQNAHRRMNPASLTKVMTALLALEYGNLNDMLTASSNVKITESGAQLIGFKEGDRITLDGALHALLMYSGNDAGVMIAEYVAGSVENFAELMNKKAFEIGATNTHFVNPHGLTNEDHYTTAYDLYLIFNEAIKNETFLKIINEREYITNYVTRDGETKELTLKTTNAYLTDSAISPEGITVIGGKTGTTDAAGSCLIILSTNQNQEKFISVLLNTEDRTALFSGMTQVLGAIN